jgi:hypothetical protein
MPIINSTPPAPRSWQRRATNIKTDWHHILPASILRDVWNSIVMQCRNTQEQQARRAMFQYLRLCDSKLAGIDETIQRLRVRQLTEAENTVLRQTAYWPPWDIVEGPTPRSDDPRNQLDKFTVGLTPAEQERMRSIERLCPKFSSFLTLGNTLNAAALSNLADTCAEARPRLACDQPIPFREEMWERDGGTWRKRRSAAAAR